MCLIDAKSIRKRLLTYFTFLVKTTYFCNFIVSEFMSAVLFAFYLIASAFVLAIKNVLQSSSSEKVFRIDTRWIVASVADIQIVREWAISQFISDTMCAALMSILSHCSIAATNKMTCPYPTSIVTEGFINMRPKDGEKCFWGILRRHTALPSGCRAIGDYRPANGILRSAYYTT